MFRTLNRCITTPYGVKTWITSSERSVTRGIKSALILSICVICVLSAAAQNIEPDDPDWHTEIVIEYLPDSLQIAEISSASFRLRMESPDAVLQRVLDENQNILDSWQQEFDARRAALPASQRAANIEITPSIEMVTAEDGGRDINLNISFSYGGDYPPGAYKPEQSNASATLLEFAKAKIETELAQFLTPETSVTFIITGETDGAQIRRGIPYSGDFGNISSRLMLLNNELHNMTVTQETGITSNAQLGFLRAVGVEDFLRKNVTTLQRTNNTFQINVVENRGTGDRYRRVSLEMVIHGALNHQMRANHLHVDEDFVPDISQNVPETEIINDDIFVLIIANENYSNDMLPTVPFAINDGKSFAQYCEKTLGIPARQIIFVQDGSLDVINSAIERMTASLRNAGDTTTAIVYYAGHGISNAETHEAFIIPSDGNPIIFDRLISLNSMYNALGVASAKSLIVILDACFSGARRNGEMIMAGANAVQTEPKVENSQGNLIVINAAEGYQSARAFREQQHGLFTYYLLKTLKDLTNNEEDITLGAWFETTKDAVLREAYLRENEQTPTVTVSSEMEDSWENIKFN